MWPGWIVRLYEKARRLSGNSIEPLSMRGFADPANCRVALYSGEAKLGEHHLAMWVPVFDKAGLDYCIITRTEALYKHACAAYPGHAVAFARQAPHLGALLDSLPNVRAVFYTSNTVHNTQAVRYNERIRQIFIGHGDSEKASSANKVFRLYDEVWTAGQSHIDRFARAPFSTTSIEFVKVGRPNLKAILEQCETPWQQRHTPPVVLYLPTWEGVFQGAEAAYSSLPIGKELLQRAVAELGCTACAKPHPCTGMGNAAYAQLLQDFTASAAQSQDIRLYPSGESLPALLPKAGICVCDVSGALTECLAANAPIFLYINPRANTMDSAMPPGSFAYTFSTPDEFVTKLGPVLAGDDPLEQGRIKAREYFMGAQETLDDTFYKTLRLRAFAS